MHRLDIDDQRRQLEFFIAQVFRHLGHHFLFEYVIDGYFERDAGERPGIARIAFRHGFREYFDAVGLAVALKSPSNFPDHTGPPGV